MRRVWRTDAVTGWMASTCLCLVAFLPRAAADVPRVIPFQGVLASPSGTPKSDGAYSITFRLYDAPSEGNLLWTEPGKSVTVSGGHGVFSTMLGEPTSIASLTFDEPYWIEVQVSGDAPMTPRLPLQTAPYALGLALPWVGGVSSPTAAVHVGNLGGGDAIQGAATGTYGIGVVGESYATHGYGVYGSSLTDAGVKGYSPNWEGVHGESQSDKGVYGGSDTWVGVWGHSNSSTGVRGESTSYIGVQGQSTSGVGVSGLSMSSTGVLGQSDTYPGVWGKTGNNSGVVGESTTGNGVYGVSDTDGQGRGENGVYGRSNVPNKGGVYGENPAGGGYGAYGNATGFSGIGVYGAAPGSSSSRGVLGTATTGYGVYGSASDPNGIGVYGESARGAHGEIGTYYSGTIGWPAHHGGFGTEIGNFAVGVLGSAGSSGGVGVLAIGSGVGDSVAPAGAFLGNIFLTGEVYFANEGVANPLDSVAAASPVTRRAVESSQALDVCSGNVTLDANGEATVSVPGSSSWNADARYQLTSIGAPAPGLYIAEEVKDGHFRIAGGSPGLKVSWQISCVRR